MNTLGSLVRKARKERKLTTTELAKSINLTQGYISHIENNRKVPSHDILNRLAQALNVPYLDLMLAAGYYSEEDLRQRKAQEDYLNSMTPLEYNEYVNLQLQSYEIEEFRRKEFTDIEELLKKNIYFNKYKLTKHDRKVVYKILTALFEDKEKNYPSDEEIEEAFHEEKRALENIMNWRNSDGSSAFEEKDSRDSNK